jgi:hypothetical protein
MRFRITTPTNSGFKCIMSKWSTAQELFVICDENSIYDVKEYIESCVQDFLSK